MTSETMTIREMCDAFEVTPRTLRFYEAKELLAPIREGQKRLFTRRDRGRLKLILRGKRFGLSLEQIRQLLDLYDVNDGQHIQMQRTLEIGGQRLDEMIRERADLDTTIAELRSQLEWLSQELATRHVPHQAAE